MTQLRAGISVDDHVEGSREAHVVLVEYGDFECPRCGEAYWELKRLLHAYGTDVALVFRHFPLTQLHPNAMAAAEAAEAAGAQGLFWEMHDLLFENQEDLEPKTLFSFADELGLELSRFARETQEHRWQARIERDFMSGVRSGVSGTPGLFVNGEPVARASLAQTIDVLLGGGAARSF